MLPKLKNLVRCVCSLVCLMVFLSGCATTQDNALKTMSNGQVQLSPQASFFLPVWTHVGAPKSYMQNLTVINKEKTGQLQVMLTVSQEELNFLAFDAFGRRALELHWGKTGIQENRASWLPVELKGQDVLGYMVLTYWPLDSVCEILEGTGFSIKRQSNSREITRNGNLVMRITYEEPIQDGWPKGVRLDHYIYGFQMIIKSVEVLS